MNYSIRSVSNLPFQRKAITQLQEIFHITPTEAENSYHFYKCNLSDAIDGLAAKMDRSLNDAIENSPISRQGMTI